MRMCSPVLLLFLVFVQTAFPQSRTIFSGVPAVKISEGGIERLVEKLSGEKATNFACVISETGGKFYWATRENKELTRNKSGTFVTFIAHDGSGYIRIVAPEMKEVASLMSDTEARFDYVEHLLIGLKSVTYYGTSK